jgi:hypothetical protein
LPKVVTENRDLNKKIHEKVANAGSCRSDDVFVGNSGKIGGRHCGLIFKLPAEAAFSINFIQLPPKILQIPNHHESASSPPSSPT